MRSTLLHLALLCALPLAALAGPPAGKFKSEEQAKKHCPSDVVVWLKPANRVYFHKGHLWYATTKDGLYACRKEAEEEGYLPG
jgi:hypothetical protein